MSKLHHIKGFQQVLWKMSLVQCGKVSNKGQQNRMAMVLVSFSSSDILF